MGIAAIVARISAKCSGVQVGPNLLLLLVFAVLVAQLLLPDEV
jgi:hypothetical protein